MAPNSAAQSPVTDETQAVSTKPCMLFINGRWVDCAKWAPYHPGGEVIYGLHGQDATDVFEAFHGEESHEQLASMKTATGATPPTPKVDKMTANFRQLVQEMKDKGMFDRQYGWYAYKIASTFMIAAFAIWLITKDMPIIGAVFLGLYWQQMGWVSHEICHHDLFKNRTYAKWAGLVMGNACQGFSATWWNDRHNSHHATTNVVDLDPDLDNLPILCWSKLDVHRLKDMPVVQKTIRYQHIYFPVILSLLRIVWTLQSVIFVMNLDSHPNRAFRKKKTWEARFLALHYVMLAAVLSLVPIGSWVPFLLISECLAGAGIAFTVFINHYPMPHMSTAEHAEANFVEMQINTTTNITPGVFNDWIFGGLNYQIEHHLFPTVPRNRLNETSVMVKKFAKENGLEYHCRDFIPGVIACTQQLKIVSNAIADEYENQKNK